jgi:hypothetical protein
MALLQQLLLFAHVLGGGLGLASMFVPLVAKKGGRLHARAGWVFVAGMTLASLRARHHRGVDVRAARVQALRR